MKRLKTILLFFSMALAGHMTTNAQVDENAALPVPSQENNSKAYTVESLPISSTFGREKFVCNPDGILSQAIADSISSIMQLLEEDTKAQVLFVAVNAIEPADEQAFATSLGNKLGVGDTSNNGMVVLLVKELRAIYFAPGMGMEDVMTKGKCQSIQNRYMVSSFKDNDWDNGMLNGAVAISECLRGNSNGEQQSSSGGSMGWLGIVGVAALGYFLAKRNGQVCPKCGKKTFKRVKKEYFKEGETEKMRFTYKCSSCGHEAETVEDRYKNFGGGKFNKDAGAGTRF